LIEEPKRREEVADKFDQLLCNGLATTDKFGKLAPLLALPELDAVQEKRRRTTANNLINKDDYESSGDELEDFSTERQTKPKVRFARLKQALERLEQPSAAPKTAGETGNPKKSLKRKAAETSSDSEEFQASKLAKPDDHSDEPQQHTWAAMPEEDIRPTLGFQRAICDPSHPDCGLSFSTALEVAMSKEHEARSLASSHSWWQTDRDESEDQSPAPAQAKATSPQTRLPRLRPQTKESAEASNNLPDSTSKKPPPRAPGVKGGKKTRKTAGPASPPTMPPRPLRIIRTTNYYSYSIKYSFQYRYSIILANSISKYQPNNRHQRAS
jgi:hypothetical protein